MNVGEAQCAVRALHEAGFAEVETFDLTPNLYEIDDVGVPLRKHKWTYYLVGSALGAMAGGSLGLILFYVPSTLLGMAHASYIIVVGMVVCAMFGSLIAFQETWIMAKRFCTEPTSSNGCRSVGVQVLSRETSRLKDAKQILARFGEQPNWYKMRSVLS